MVSDGIKAAQIQAGSSPLISSWGSAASQAVTFKVVLKNASGLINSRHQDRKAGRHAGPVKSRSSLNRHVPRHAAA